MYAVHINRHRIIVKKNVHYIKHYLVSKLKKKQSAPDYAYYSCIKKRKQFKNI